MGYTRTTWVSKSEDGTIPLGAPAINAENLNNIENGIEEALNGVKNLSKTSKEYADTNILFFDGEFDCPSGTWIDIFQISEDIDISKFIVLFQSDIPHYEEYSHMKFIPLDTEYPTCAKIVASRKSKVKISSNGLVSYYYYCGEIGVSETISMKLLLIPVSKFAMNPLT